MTEEEKLIVEARTRDNAVVRKQKIVVFQYWEATREPRLWLLIFASIAHNLQNGGLIDYSTVLIRGLGFTPIQSVIFQIPSGAQTGSYVMMITIIGSAVSGYSKKIFYNGILMFGYTIVNFSGPLMLVGNTSPEYAPAMWSFFTGNIFNMLCLFTIRIIRELWELVI
ncbi:hypothetical protein BD770DRAFT_415568 [Pilaira anomala]|nr:hypothetical protein BD770DRAFT_415568 [Pilaira anomala]